MVKNKQQIIDEIKAHIEKRGGDFPEWFVGTSPARERLFNGHQVQEKSDPWILRRAASPAVACEVKEFFLGTLAADGRSGATEDAANAVYAYRKASHTKP